MSSSRNRFFWVSLSLFLYLMSSKGWSMSGAVVTVPPLVSVVETEHSVLKGETLYSIACSHKLDVKELAAINNIMPPDFKLKVGQCLSLQSGKMPVETISTLVNTTWHWPTTGKIIKTFSNELNKALNKGIDIAGQLGSPILAAMSGKVVYSGNGLRGLGQLLIIKHGEHFLSAYAHNQELMVKEGQYVKQGDVVATMGGQGADTAKLHFEIRYKGHAVNPLNYLPQ